MNNSLFFVRFAVVLVTSFKTSYPLFCGFLGLAYIYVVEPQPLPVQNNIPEPEEKVQEDAPERLFRPRDPGVYRYNPNVPPTEARRYRSRQKGQYGVALFFCV
jgi:hypothetical protein